MGSIFLVVATIVPTLRSQDLEEDIAEWYFKEVEAKELLECEAVAENNASAQSSAPDEIACHREPSAVEEDVSPLMDTVKDFMGDTFRSVLGPAASVGAPPRDARPAAPPRGKTLLEKFASGACAFDLYFSLQLLRRWE